MFIPSFVCAQLPHVYSESNNFEFAAQFFLLYSTKGSDKDAEPKTPRFKRGAVEIFSV